jgi:hypothetical protein
MPNDVAQRDGSLDWSSGTNSLCVTTLASDQTPNGIRRDQLCWMGNCTVRDGGITQRAGIIKIATIPTTGIASKIFQGAWPYTPSGADPYELWSIGGNILRVNEDGTTTNLSAMFGLFNNPTEPFAFYVQGERFAIIQSGDNSTLPLIWDGAILRRSNGLTGNVSQPSQQVRNFTATDFFQIPIVGGTVTIDLNAQYPGILGEQGVLRGVGGAFDIGTFNVTAFTAVAPFTVTLQTVSSSHIGENFPPFNYQFTLTAIPAPVPINEIPAATAMDYYAGRIWYAIGRVVSAGDIVNGTSGTQAYNFKDSILKVTENPLAIGGDGFEMPSQDDNIRGIAHGAAIDASLGQGRLFIFTRKAVYGLQVPVNRTDWIDANANNQPLVTIVQLVNGSVNDRSIVPVNGDLYYQSLEPGIRSLDQSVRQFSMAGNRLLSANEQRIMQFNDRSLMRAASGIYFNNRLLQTALPRQTPFGIVHDALVPLDFLPISTMQQDRKSNWEGAYSGVPIMQMAVLDFGGRERAFAVVLGDDNEFQLWEITTAEKFDFSLEGATQNRVEWYFETPAFTWSGSHGELEFKKLVGAELWVDRLSGTVVFDVDYRPNGTTCWLDWIEWSECSAKNTAETVTLPIGYPVNLGECFKATMILPKPDPDCQPCNNAYPANVGLQFQLRISIKGFCRVRGVWMWAEKVEKGMYQPRLVC